VTAHPTAQWTRQQLREAVGYEEQYAYLLHDRDTIFSAELDESIQRLGLRVLKSPPRSPKANALCERVLGTLRRECLDWHDNMRIALQHCPAVVQGMCRDLGNL